MTRIAITAAALAALTLASASPAAGAAKGDRPEPIDLTRSTEGVVYFNRPGADMATHNAELKDCIAGVGVNAMREAAARVSTNTGGLYGMAVEGAFTRITTELCMLARGWRLVRLGRAEGEKLEQGSRADIVAAITPWVGAAEPHGTVVRVYANDALAASTEQLRMGRAPAGELLSARALNLRDEIAPPPIAIRREKDGPPVVGLKPYPVLTAATLPPAPPPGMALVVFRMRGHGGHNGQGFNFQLLDAEGASRQPGPDLQGPGQFYTGLPWSLIAKGRGTPLETFAAVAVPAGRWRLFARMTTMHYCLGSPSFEAREGEVVWLGAFDLAGETVAPDMSLDPARAFLAAQPALAERVRPAAWVNGSLGHCKGAYVYALEFPGYPYEPGYAWGSRAQPQPAG